MTFYNNICNGSYTEVSISTNRLLYFMHFNSYQSIVYSACDILILLMVEDSEYTIPKLVEVNPPDPNTGKRLSLKEGKRLPGKVINLANPQVADTKDYWFLDHFVNRVKVPFGEKTEINFWHSY